MEEMVSSPPGLGRYYAVRLGRWKLIFGNPGRGDWASTDPRAIPPVKMHVPGCKLPEGDTDPALPQFDNIPGAETWLFDLENDPEEHQDLSEAMPEKLRELREHAALIINPYTTAVVATASTMSPQERESLRAAYFSQFRESAQGLPYVEWWADSPELQKIESAVLRSRL